MDAENDKPSDLSDVVLKETSNNEAQVCNLKNVD